MQVSVAGYVPCCLREESRVWLLLGVMREKKNGVVCSALGCYMSGGMCREMSGG